MQINMPDSGTFLFISDHCHVIENVSSPFLAVPKTDIVLVARWYPSRLACKRSSSLVPEYAASKTIGKDYPGSSDSWA